MTDEQTAMQVKRGAGIPRLTADERKEAMRRLVLGESANALAREYGCTRQSMDGLRERAKLIGLKADAGETVRGGYAAHPAIKAALDDRDSACGALAKSAERAFKDERMCRRLHKYHLAAQARNSGVATLNALASYRGWVLKPTNAAEQQTSDALAASVGAWIESMRTPALPLSADCTITQEECIDVDTQECTEPVHGCIRSIELYANTLDATQEEGG